MKPNQLRTTAVWLAAVGAVTAGWVELVESGHLLDVVGGQVVFFTLAALAAPALTTAMVRRHPHEPTGALVGACLLGAMLAACRTTPLGAFTPVAGVAALLTPLLPAYVVISYSALQTPPRVARAISWCFWVSGLTGAGIAVTVLSTGSVPGTLWFTEQPARASTMAQVLLVAQTSVVVVALIALSTTYRRRRLPRNARSALRPMMWPATAWAAAALAAAVWTALASIHSPVQTDLGGDASNTFIVLPAVLVGVLAVGIGWIDLVVRGSATALVDIKVEQYLSQALADPSIRVLYPIPGEEWVTTDGQPATPDFDATDRAVTMIRRGSTLIGLIEQDAANTARPDAVELIATGAGLIMETERLTAAANRDLEQSRLLAARLLSAADAPRQVLRADLLAGPLAELDAVADALNSGHPLADVVARLTAIAADVRTISHGVFPPSLTTGGLRAALPGRVVPERRLPALTEMTAYLAAREDPAATIAEGSSGLQITTTRSPSPAVRDRVTALGGEFEKINSTWSITVPIAGR